MGRRRSGAGGSLRYVAATLLLATVAASALYAALDSVTDADLWWHLAVGRYIAEHRAIPARDVFSYTADGAPWQNHEWLSQVVLYAGFAAGGGRAVAMLKIVAVCLAFAIATWIWWRRSSSLAAAAIAAVAAVPVCRPYLDVRPNLVAFLGTLVLMAVLESSRRGGRLPVRVVLPAIFVVWVNLHSSFIYGIAVLWLVALLEWSKSSSELARRLLGAAAISTLACTLNPLGLGALTFPFSILDRSHAFWRSEIIEWQRPVLFQELPFNPAAFGYYLVAQVLLAVCAGLLDRRRLDRTDVGHVAMTLALALTGRRFVPLFGFVSIPFAATNLATIASVIVPHRMREGAWGYAILTAACAPALGLVLSFGIPEVRDAHRVGLFAYLTDERYFPSLAADFLRANPPPERILSLYAWGGFMMYRLPGWKVFIDPRGHTVYPQSLYQDERLVELGDRRWSEVLARHHVAMVLWPTESFALPAHRVVARALRTSPEWLCIYADPQAAVYAHRERARDLAERYARHELTYPDNARAQLFRANTYLETDELDRARDVLLEVLARYPDTRKVAVAAENGLAQTATSTNDASAWFGVGFYREVLGDRPGAVDAYRTALARGLGGRSAAYAEAALERSNHPFP